MVDLLTPDSFSDVVRYVVAMMGIGLIGFNLVIIIHAPKLLPKAAVKTTRQFFLAKTVMTGMLSYLLLDRDGEITWRTIVVFLGFLMAIRALWLGYWDRPLAAQDLHEVQPKPDEVTLVHAAPKRPKREPQ
jgi:protein-S-isoprenylcysteine O-methyltransferase Ste14